MADRVLVAGGGAGQDPDPFDPGTAGKGGGLPDGGSGGIPYCTPGAGSPVAGGGGTQSSGGTGGAGSNGGSLGIGGVGVSFCLVVGSRQRQYMSSGGGGGYYGGGGGGDGGAGGGGSGYAEPAATNVSSKKGVNSGNGSALICWGYRNGECGSR
ncbi:MAG: glycine-rich protein [Candidatus Cybelea sp.]